MNWVIIGRFLMKLVMVQQWFFGGTIAVVLSYSLHRSVLWAVVHGTLGWFYIVYHFLTYRGPVFGA